MYRLILWLIIFAVVLNLILFYRFTFISNLDQYQRKYVDYDSFDTGDILLVSFENFGKFFVGSMLNMEFLHPTIVVKEEGETYVLEVMGYTNKKGFLKLKLEEWINRNKNCNIMVNKLDIEDDSKETREELARKLLAYTNRYTDGSEKITDVGYFDLSWFRYLNPKGIYKHPKLESGKTPCNEFCTRILVEAGVVKGDKPLEHYYPDQFIGMKGFTVNQPYRYGEHFLCDLNRFMKK